MRGLCYCSEFEARQMRGLCYCSEVEARQTDERFMLL